MIQRTQIKIACCLILLGTWATAQARPRFGIAAQRVTEALAVAGVRATPGQVRFLSPITAVEQDPVLQVMHVGNWTDRTQKIELRCHDHHACLPFYVLVSNDGLADSQGRTRMNPPQESRASEAKPAVALMRDGEAATLVFEGGALRITMPVICLQSGNRGQTIRVVSTDHKRFFSAEIIGSGLLRAAL